MFHKYRSSCPKVFCKIDFVKDFTKFARKHLCRSLVLKKQRTTGNYKENPTQVFSCEFLRTLILKNFCKWLLSDLFYENKPPAPKGWERITAEVFVSFGIVWLRFWYCCTSKYLCLLKQISQQPDVSTWCVFTNQISNFVRFKYKFSLYLRAEAPHELTCIQIEIMWSLGQAVMLNLRTDKGSSES